MRISLFLLALLVCPLHADWRDSLTPENPGPTPEIREFDAEFRFGWSDIEAARANASIRYSGDEVILNAKGGTTGVARLLWQIDAKHHAQTHRKNFRTVWVEQIEKYAKRTVFTQIVARPDGIWRLRETEKTPSRWKKVKVSPLRDLFSGMLFIRSQRLAPGDRISTIIYPGDNPFLVELQVLGTETLSIAGNPRDAIKLNLRIHRINSKKGILEKHGKFRSGTVWLSNDADRVPLRAEVDLFIGYVFGELVSLKFVNH